MRAILFRLSLLLLLSSATATAAEGVRASPWEGRGADGHSIRFDPDHLERPAILMFWATWCPYCKALMPHVQTVYDAAGKAKLDVYAIDIQDDGDPVAELRERGQTFTLVRDGDAIAKQYGVKGTPGLLLVDRSGAIVYRRVGGDAPEAVEAALRERLGLPALPPASSPP
ncbi:TlpA family protein disulfide reductase [Dokdonella fugitiva]|jgi:thiol-disulfide isomerase/thioredoxin|uniref:Thiol-disulfide isomerase/thioredoxin n=1 Tax=Dokdonella fugitiva TaxID=328517 RepID=A0A4R2IF76_9GAMM|nr:TlpA disulfide reductase family protein [Dokdonella fugitiva]TCO42866.1 thiol-disulfide isomerase/thioredoxin [Dokdonella fugitiva]